MPATKERKGGRSHVLSALKLFCFLDENQVVQPASFRRRGSSRYGSISKRRPSVSAARRRESNMKPAMKPTMTHPNVPTLDQNNPEALLDVLTMKSKTRYADTGTPNLIKSDEDLERYVRDFPIDDSISQCFENNAAILDNSCIRKEQLAVANRSESQEKLVSDTDSDHTSEPSKKNFIGSLFGKKSKVKDRTSSRPGCNGTIPVKRNAFENNSFSQSETSSGRLSGTNSKNLQAPKDKQVIKNNENGIEIGPDFKTDDGNTLLHLAVLSSSCDTTERLLEQHPELCDTKNKAGLTPIDMAVQLGYIECIRTIIDKQPCLSRTNGVSFWNNLLIHAVKNEQHECLEFLIEKMKSLEVLNDGRIDTEDNSPAHIAAQYGSEICLQVLAENGYDMFSKNKNGKSPLNIASEEKSFRCSNYLLALDMCKQLTEVHCSNKLNRRDYDIHDTGTVLQQLHNQMKHVQSSSEEFLQEINEIRENIMKSLSVAESRLMADSIGSDMHRRLTSDLQASKNRLADLMDFSPVRSQQKTIGSVSRELEALCKRLPTSNTTEPLENTVAFEDIYRLFLKRRKGRNETLNSKDILIECINEVCDTRCRMSRSAVNGGDFKSQQSRKNSAKSFDGGFSSISNTSYNAPSGLVGKERSNSGDSGFVVDTPSSVVKQTVPKSIHSNRGGKVEQRDLSQNSEVPDLIHTNSFTNGCISFTENTIQRKNSMNSQRIKALDRRPSSGSRNRRSFRRRNNVACSPDISTKISAGNVGNDKVLKTEITHTNSLIQGAPQIKQICAEETYKHDSEDTMFSPERGRGTRLSEHAQSVQRLVETQKSHSGNKHVPFCEQRRDAVSKDVCVQNGNLKTPFSYVSKHQRTSNMVCDSESDLTPPYTSTTGGTNTDSKIVKDTNVSARDAFIRMFPERKPKPTLRLGKNCLARISPRYPPAKEMPALKEKAWYDASEDEESLYATYHSDSDKTLDDSILFGPVDSV